MLEVLNVIIVITACHYHRVLAVTAKCKVAVKVAVEVAVAPAMEGDIDEGV